jgi:phage terminase Nu1 subunit (DNA packaging protein)
MVKSEQEGGISQKALGRALNLSPAAISKLKGQGMPVHSVEAASAWRRERQSVARRKPDVAPPAAAAGLGASASAVPDYNASRARREAAEARLAELRLAEDSGELVRAADVRAHHAGRLAMLRESLLQIPARLAPVLAVETDQARCHDLMQRELHGALEQAARA